MCRDHSAIKDAGCIGLYGVCLCVMQQLVQLSSYWPQVSPLTQVVLSTVSYRMQDKDLDLPLHSDRAHRLLEPNTAAINMSYTVF